MVVPSAKKEPDIAELVTVSRTQLSEATGAVQLTLAPQTPESLLTTILLGQPVNDGASVSFTVMVALSVAPAVGGMDRIKRKANKRPKSRLEVTFFMVRQRLEEVAEMNAKRLF